jgi:filamentous hemagglutinin family protein
MRCGTLVVAGMLTAGAAAADPKGVTVVAAFTHGPLVITQTTSKVIFNWDAFSIHAGTVTFTMPGTTQTALNRVTGAPSTVLLGALTANGQVFLINPAGKVTLAGTISAAPVKVATLSAPNNTTIAATTAKSVLDNLINTSRIVEARTAALVTAGSC